MAVKSGHTNNYWGSDKFRTVTAFKRYLIIYIGSWKTFEMESTVRLTNGVPTNE
jgi:hypothetical protein